MKFEKYIQSLNQEDVDVLQRASEILDIELKHLWEYARDYNTISEEVTDAKSDISKVLVKGNSSLIWFKDGSFTIEQIC